jgi:histidine triad (HIT) family protein
MYKTDIFRRDDLVTGFLNFFSLGGVAGNALIIPNKHFEHIYELPAKYGHRVSEVLQKTAIAMRQPYRCDGITTLQCNEPAGGQRACYYHQHVMQRYTHDDFMNKMLNKAVVSKDEKQAFATRLREAISVTVTKL